LKRFFVQLLAFLQALAACGNSKRKTQHLKLSALALLLALTACGGGGVLPGYTTQQQTVDGISFTLERPQQAELLKDYELFVVVSDATGKPVDNAIVFLNMAMPAMPMPPQQPIADVLGSGRYRVRNTFLMEGDWQVLVHATIAGKEYIATFDQPVKLAQ
jgi:predicted small lipoprotein YifL